ncbi:hypothetical protein PINS_up001917 [Pythium insidiosum]|nr:hypothetical protein PINS_up001917 [Pythium insidiosum]
MMRPTEEHPAFARTSPQPRYQSAPDDREEKSNDRRSESALESTEAAVATIETHQQTQERDEYAREIEQAAEEQVEQQRRGFVAPVTAKSMRGISTFSVTRLGDDDFRGSGHRGRVRGRGRTAGTPESQVRVDSDLSGAISIDSVRQGDDDDRRVAITATAFQAGVVSDNEIQGAYGSIPNSLQNDVYGLGGFGGITYSASPAEIVTAVDTGPIYRGTEPAPEYVGLTPPASPSFADNDSFISQPQYNALSPTNSIRDDDFPSEDFHQVHRSIRYTGDDRVVPSPGAGLPNFEDVPGKRDKVHFCSYAPPSVAPARKPFNFTVWAFLLAQRQEMREQAETFDASSRQLSVDAQMVVRRGALVHVTLEVPTGFNILNGATQGFSWEGSVTNVVYDIECTDGADFGQVLFKASIVVGSEVAVLRSYISVSSRALDPADLEAQMLQSKLEVLEKTFHEVPYMSLELKDLVGRGYFGDAYRATYNGQDVVVKTLRASEFGESNDQILKEFQHEAAVLSMFGHHPCVVPFVGASTDMRFPLCLITKYLPGGSLEDNLKDAETRARLSIRQRTLMLKDAAAGLLNIHEGGFIHRDVAARNCLVDQNMRVKICDFGLCRRVNAYGGSLMKDSVGPIKYMAPESLQPPHSFSFNSDSWMFGVLMYETYTATAPFHTMTPIEAMMRVVRGERLPVPENLSDDLQSLMESCFHDLPGERPSMAEILTALDRSAAEMTPSTPVVTKAASAVAMASLSSNIALERRDRTIWV